MREIDQYFKDAVAAGQVSLSQCAIGISNSSVSSGGGSLMGGNTARSLLNAVREPSMADRIEDRMTRLQNDLDRLRRIKKQLGEPNGVLSMSASDFEFMLRY